MTSDEKGIQFNRLRTFSDISEKPSPRLKTLTPLINAKINSDIYGVFRRILTVSANAGLVTVAYL